MILRGLITWAISQTLLNLVSTAKVVPLSDNPLNLDPATGTGDNVCPPAGSLSTSFVSIWLKPPGFLKFYQAGDGSFTVMNQEILYGTISSLTLATAKTLYQSENWLNVIFRVVDTAGGCKFDKFYIRKFAEAEIDNSNTVSRELPNYMTYFETPATKKLSLAPTELLNGTPSRLLVPSGAKILFSTDPEMSLVTFMGNTYQGTSTIFATDTFELHTGHSADEIEVYYKMIVLGRPKPMFQIPIFTQYFNIIPKLQKPPYDIDDYMSRVFDHGRVGYTLKLGQAAGFGPVEFNYDSFSNTIVMEFQVQLLALHSGVNGLQLNLTFNSTDLDPRRSEFSPLRLEVTKPDPALPTVWCSVYDQRNGNLLAKAQLGYIDLLVDANSALSFQIFLGFGLLYTDTTTTLVERMVAVGATDGYNSAWDGQTMTFDEPFFLLSTSAKESLNITLTPDCLACTAADQMSFRFLKYQVLFGAFSPKYIVDWKAPQVPTSTKICGMVLDKEGDTSGTGINLFRCSSLFMFITSTTLNYYSTGPVGIISNAASVPDPNCVVRDSTGSCLVCDSTTTEEFSLGLGDAGTFCFTDISCPKLEPASNTYSRRIWTYPTTNRKVCHSVLSGCQTSLKPLNCDTCEPFKAFIEPNNTYSCQCAVQNCQTCQNSPCETCTADLPTIYINKSTSIFMCQTATECNTTAGVVLAPGIIPLPTTTWCRDCLDSNCENCTADSETCINCLPSFYFDPLRTCQPCVSNCSECLTFADNCTSCIEGQVTVANDTRSYCMPILTVNYTYFVVSISTAYIKFNEQLNPNIKLDNMKVKMFASEADYKEYLASPTTFQKAIPVEVLSFKIYMSHLIYELKISTTSIESGIMEVALENRQLVNSSDGQKFYSESKILVTDIMYYRSESEFENYLGLLFGILLGLTGLLSLFIPALKYTIMSMKVFQMNNYFFLINVNLPANLYLFFRYIQYGNVINLLVSINPMGFLTDGKCKEYERKLLVIGRDCQLFSNAGPHFLWFGISFAIKMILELVQYNKEKSGEKSGEKRGKLYEFLKLKFGRRYFIELLSYFHMDLVLYNLLNLFFAELGSGVAFFNLLVSVVFMVFFIYYYISLFVIIADNSKDFLLNNLCDPDGKLGLVRKDDADDGIGGIFRNKTIGPGAQAEKTVTEDPDEESSNTVQYDDLPPEEKERLKVTFAHVVSNFQSPEAKRKITIQVEKLADEEKRKGTFKIDDATDDNKSTGNQVSSRNFGQISTRGGMKLSKADKRKAELEEQERQALLKWKQEMYIKLSIKEEFYIVAKAIAESLKQKKKIHEFKVKEAAEKGQEAPIKSDFMIKRRKPSTKAKDNATYSGANIYRFLFASSHCQNMYSKQYYAVGYVKELLLALVLVLSYSNPFIQTIVFTLIFVLHLYLNVSRAPLQNKFNNKLLNAYTGLYVTMSFMTFVLVLFAGRVNAAILHFFFGYLLMVIEMAIIGVVITMAVSEFLKKRKDRLENEKHLKEMQERDAAIQAEQANKESGALNKSSRRKNNQMNASKPNLQSKTGSKPNLEGGVKKPLKKKSTISSRSGIYEDVSEKSGDGKGGNRPPVKIKDDGTEEMEGMEEDITVSNPAEEKESVKRMTNSQASKPNVIRPAGKKPTNVNKRQSNFSTGSFMAVDRAMPPKKIKQGGVFFTKHQEVDIENSQALSSSKKKSFVPATHPNHLNSGISESGFSGSRDSASQQSGGKKNQASGARVLRPKQDVTKEMGRQLQAKRVDSADDVSAEISIDALNIEAPSDGKSKQPTKTSLPSQPPGRPNK